MTKFVKIISLPQSNIFFIKQWNKTGQTICGMITFKQEI